MLFCFLFFFFKQKTAYEMRISDWSSDVCSSDLAALRLVCLETCHSEGFWLAADHHICAWRITGGHRLVDGRFRPGRTDGGQPYPPGRAFAECVSDYWSRCLGGARSAGACTQSCPPT